MEQIKELGNIIQQQKPEVFKELAQADSKKGMLLRAIMEGLVRSDNEASMLIYGKIDQGKKYQMLKRNLKENLIEHINHVTQKNQAFHLQVESECKEKLRLVASLLTNNVFHNAEKILNQVFKKLNNIIFMMSWPKLLPFTGRFSALKDILTRQKFGIKK
jgi:hypothetical protein